MFKVKIESKDEWIEAEDLDLEDKVVELSSDAPKALEPTTTEVMDFVDACNEHTYDVAVYMIENTYGEPPIGYFLSKREAAGEYILMCYEAVVGDAFIEFFDSEAFLDSEGIELVCVDQYYWFAE